MACYHPSKVAISRKSLPGSVSRTLDRVTVPCGHCLGCRTDQARSWAVRLVHEGEVSSPAWFVTLTYSPEKLPDHGTLSPDDVTRFVKRLRRMYEGERISYYYAGEYGDETARPHYHLVLYGARFLERVLLTRRNDAPVYRSESLERCWGYGLCEFTALNYAAARYVASYVRKKVRQRDCPDHYVRVDPRTGELVEIEREFGRMSRRPAIGRRWIERYWKDVYPRDYVVMDGRELKPPRYYDKFMETEHVKKPCRGGCRVHQEVMAEVRWKRMEEMEILEQSKLDAMGKVHAAKVALLEGRSAV